jgi:hypothetical protein
MDIIDSILNVYNYYSTVIDKRTYHLLHRQHNG